jgi:AAA domain
MSQRRRSIKLEQPPLEIIRGAQIMAEYLPQEVLQLRDNPLNEALPPTLTPRGVIEYLLQLPPYSNKDRELRQSDRILMTETAREFFVPNGKHLMVYYAIMNMIRRGYVRRNPVLWEYWKRVHQNIKSFLKAIKEKPLPNSRARGLAIVGSGGTGKSTTIEKILQSLPQVITHVSYKNQDFIMKQLVWLKLDCPRNGSLREFCINFFTAVDEILGTQYKKNYAGSSSSHRTLEELITGMARVAANHCLGIIVIDEIQDLSEARSGGDVTMVNFFVHLENKIGVPFVLVGTQDAEDILCSQFRHARRVSEQGYITWDRMSEVEPEIEDCDDDDDEEDTASQNTSAGTLAHPGKGNENKNGVARPDPVWKDFVETLWIYQYVKHPRELDKVNVVKDKCAHALYQVAKGIPAVVQTVFVLTQQRAILNEEEKITPRLIRETFQINQQAIEKIFGETRMKKPREIKPVSDLADMDQIYEAEDLSECFSTNVGAEDTRNTVETEDKVVRDATCDSRQKNAKSATSTQDKSGQTSAGSNTKKSRKKQSSKQATLKSDLPIPTTSVSGQANDSGSRKKDKYRRSPDEYLKRK